jgi:Fe-S cluster assembly protein SufD
MSRGLSYHQSRQLLINGFLQEVIEKISVSEIKELIKRITGIKDEN